MQRGPGDYTARGSRAQSSASRAERDRRRSRDSRTAPLAQPPEVNFHRHTNVPEWPNNCSWLPFRMQDDQDEWRNRKTRDTRREERQASIMYDSIADSSFVTPSCLLIGTLQSRERASCQSMGRLWRDRYTLDACGKRVFL